MPSELSGYRLGKTPCFACISDQRFSYCLYVPSHYAKNSTPARLLVAIHDTTRDNAALRDLFVDYADKTNSIVVAPLFPAGIVDAEDLDNYKFLAFSGIRFDQILLAMVDEVAARYGVDGSRFALFGFSGGAHFAHRFLYVHPERLEAVVAGSPGSVTLPTEDYRWWAGLANFAEIFGGPVRWDLVRKVPVCLLVGAADVNPRGIVRSKENPSWVEGANAAGDNRVERLRTLHSQLKQRGIQIRFEALSGVGHELEPIAQAAIRFLSGARDYTMLASA